MRRAIKIACGIAGATAALAVAVHVPMLFGRAGGCPFGFDKVATDAPIHHDPRLRGDAVAPARPALGFTLGTTTRAEVERTVVANGGSCRPAGPELECTRVPTTMAPDVTTAWFAFGAGARLDSVRTVRRAPSPVAIGDAFANLERDLTARAGAPVRSAGSPAPSDLARGALRQAAVEYRFANYRAVLRATNLDNRTYALTEEYQNLVD